MSFLHDGGHDIGCDRITIQKNYGWPSTGKHCCYNMDCKNVIDCNPNSSPLCSTCHSKYRCKCVFASVSIGEYHSKDYYSTIGLFGFAKELKHELENDKK